MASQSNKLKIFLTLITVLGSITVALIQYHPWKSDNKKVEIKVTPKYVISGAVFDEATNQSISHAEINIVGRNEQYYTEQNGNFTITFHDSIPVVRLRVLKKTYLPFDKSYDVPQGSILIPLTRIHHD